MVHKKVVHKFVYFVFFVYICTMRLKINKAAEPQWESWDYAIASKEDLFSAKRWGYTVDWDIILNQVEKIQQVSQMIDVDIYPSQPFFDTLDLLETNMLVLDDMVYYLTGIRIDGNIPLSEEAQMRLGFWNMDCYEVLGKIIEGLKLAGAHLTDSVRRRPLLDIGHKITEIDPLFVFVLDSAPVSRFHTQRKGTYAYIRARYEVADTDQDALASQIYFIQSFIARDCGFFACAYNDLIEFPKLLALFRKSEKAQAEYIEPWRHDFGGTRDSLIAKMEKDPKLGPWVNRYDHLSKDKGVRQQLFCSDKDPDLPINEEECYNTNNWLSILTIAAVLQEYDELHPAGDSKPYDEEVLVDRLSVYFTSEDQARRFMNAAKQMKSDKEIVALVKKKWNDGVCTNKSIDLWRLLHDAGLYTAGYGNWNKQL